MIEVFWSATISVSRPRRNALTLPDRACSPSGIACHVNASWSVRKHSSSRLRQPQTATNAHHLTTVTEGSLSSSATDSTALHNQEIQSQRSFAAWLVDCNNGEPLSGPLLGRGIALRWFLRDRSDDCLSRFPPRCEVWPCGQLSHRSLPAARRTATFPTAAAAESRSRAERHRAASIAGSAAIKFSRCAPYSTGRAGRPRLPHSNDTLSSAQ